MEGYPLAGSEQQSTERWALEPLCHTFKPAWSKVQVKFSRSSPDWMTMRLHTGTSLAANGMFIFSAVSTLTKQACGHGMHDVALFDRSFRHSQCHMQAPSLTPLVPMGACYPYQTTPSALWSHRRQACWVLVASGATRSPMPTSSGLA